MAKDKIPLIPKKQKKPVVPYKRKEGERGKAVATLEAEKANDNVDYSLELKDRFGLNDKQFDFAMRRANKEKLYEAYIGAGYEDHADRSIVQRNSYRLKNNPKILAFLNEWGRKVIAEQKFSFIKLAKRYDKVYGKCMEPVPILHNGEDTGFEKYDPTNAIRANKELTNMMGYTSDAKEAPAPININILQQMFQKEEL